MTKTEARRIARERLRALEPQWRARAGAQIARRVWDVPEVAAARVLLVYASLPLEVPTDAIAEEAHRRGKVVVYPRCLTETHELALHRVAAGEALLELGSYGIREPGADCPRVAAAEIDVALVPGLAWDRAGRRLGRGAGYYDRLFDLPEWRAFRCGLFFASQELPELPADPWDAPLHAAVTEAELVRLAEPGREA